MPIKTGRPRDRRLHSEELVGAVRGASAKGPSILPAVDSTGPLFVRRKVVAMLALLLATATSRGEDPSPRQTAVALAADKLFARENLVAWCIVPFDAKKRGPEQRAQMLSRLGFTKFAYDYRAEHIPTFDAELDALKRHGIKLVAWWFPGELNDEAQGILATLQRHKLQPELWVTGGGGPTQTDEERRARVKAESDRIRPIAEAAGKMGCRVGLYNHEGWFGEPENELAILEQLKMPNVGMVYNFHHGHDHLDRFASVDEEIHVARVDVGRGRLVLPTALGPPDDVVVVCLAIAEGGLFHRVLAYEWQAPDDGVHGAAFHHALLERCRGYILCGHVQYRQGE
jgi:hypothetical protein